jgi:deazaflavin-dependent oxidoreductase (nitroreductase family)
MLESGRRLTSVVGAVRVEDVPLPRGLAELNKHITNRVALRIAGWMPGFAIVHHVGRSTGNQYDTPVNVFRHDDGYLFALTYGMASWVKNVLAANGCTITTRGATIELAHPHVYTDPDRSDIPPPAKWVLGWVHVDQFLVLHPD